MVYLIHFDQPYKHARHYIGYAEDVQARFQRHLSGDGARLIEVVVSAGISIKLVRTWPGDRSEERKLKNRKQSWRQCPICLEERKQKAILARQAVMDSETQTQAG